MQADNAQLQEKLYKLWLYSGNAGTEISVVSKRLIILEGYFNLFPRTGSEK